MKSLYGAGRWGVLALVGWLVLAGMPAAAQVLKGQILGVVADQSGALVPGVKVTILETRTNFQRTTETNDTGNFFFVNLDPGDYRVEAEKTGFNKALRSGVELLPNTTARVNFELVPGAVTQTIDVSASAAPLLQTDRADTGGKIDQKQLQSLPMLFNRNYQGLLLLVPGVGRPFRPHSEFYNSHDSLSVRVNGQGRQFNNFQIEGIENKIDNGNLTALVPPAEAKLAKALMLGISMLSTMKRFSRGLPPRTMMSLRKSLAPMATPGSSWT